MLTLRFALCGFLALPLAAACTSTPDVPEGQAGTSGGGNGAMGGSGGSGGTGADGGSGGSPLGDLYVDSSLGDDAAAGTVEAPLKTIRRALELFEAERRIVLVEGFYSEASGEVWDYVLPDGVVIHGDGEGVRLVGTPETTAFETRGANLEYLTFEAFSEALVSHEGTTELRGVTFHDNATALSLDGTADARLSSSCAFLGQGVGAHVAGTASLTMDTGIMTDVSTPSALIHALDSSSVALSDVDGELLVGSLIWVDEEAAFSISDSSVELVAGNSLIEMSGEADVTIADTNLHSHDEDATVVFVFGGTLEVTGSTVVGADADAGYGVTTSGNPVVSLTNVSFSNHGNGALRIDGGDVTVASCIFQGNGQSMEVSNAAELSVRGTTVVSGDYAVFHTGTHHPDLGSVAMPGGNDFSGADKCLYVSGVTGSMTAVGNTWKPNVQGADSMGHYTSDDSFFGPVTGNNVTIPNNFIVGM
jgi:hypothetical protein